jgi:DNA-binding MarR family transcriptional regulator
VIEDSITRVLAGWGATRPELDVEAIAVTARLARIQAELSPRLEGVFARFGLRGADFAGLATLVRLGRDGVSQKRLAAELGLSAGTVSLRIDRLVRNGLAVRRADPGDGRGALVSLTDHGRALFEACAPEHLTNARELLAGLSERERDQLALLLSKLLYTLEAAAPDESDAQELGLRLDAAPAALERRRSVGLPPLVGLLVRHVDPSGVGAAGGIRAGDLLTKAGRRPLRSRHDLTLALNDARRRNRRLALEVTRGNESMRILLSTSAGPAVATGP